MKERVRQSEWNNQNCFIVSCSFILRLINGFGITPQEYLRRFKKQISTSELTWSYRLIHIMNSQFHTLLMQRLWFWVFLKFYAKYSACTQTVSLVEFVYLSGPQITFLKVLNNCLCTEYPSTRCCARIIRLYSSDKFDFLCAFCENIFRAAVATSSPTLKAK